MVLSSAWDKSIIAFALWGTPRMLQQPTGWHAAVLF